MSIYTLMRLFTIRFRMLSAIGQKNLGPAGDRAR